MQQFGASTHVGIVRDNNEDSFVCDTEKLLWIIADGMGGLGFGEVASAITTYTLTKEIRAGQGVNQAIELAHQRLKEYAIEEAQGTNMGTTLVLLLSQGNLYNIFWVGDSRAYSFNKTLSQLSVDHSLIQTLIDRGELTPEQARNDSRRNAVTRALGVQELKTVRADYISERWQAGQKILLCSDGLTDLISDAEIEAVLQQQGTDQQLADRLVDMAVAAGGRDNVTVTIVSAPEGLQNRSGDNQYVDTHIPDETASRPQRDG